MLKIRTKLFSILIWIVFLAGIGGYTTYYAAELASNAHKTVSLKSAANDLISSISNIGNVLTFYSVSELSTTTTTTTTTTELMVRQEALMSEYEFAIHQLDEPIGILKSDKSLENNMLEISAASKAFSSEAETIFILIKKRLEAESELTGIMAKIRENRHRISDVIKAGSRGSEKLKLDVAETSYKEKEYNFQYQDKKHADEWLASVNNVVLELKKEGFAGLSPFAESYLEFAQKAIDKRTEIQDLQFNEKYHLELIKNNIINTNISILRVIDLLDKNLNEIIERSATQRRTFLTIIFFVFAFSGISIFLIAKSVIASIGGLIKTAEKISAGDLTQRAIVRSKDEIGYLAEVFNRMLDNIERSEKDLLSSGQKLQGAYQDIEKSNVLLKEQLEDLEKFKKLVVGRELKMVELKEQIEVLEKKLINN